MRVAVGGAWQDRWRLCCPIQQGNSGAVPAYQNSLVATILGRLDTAALLAGLAAALLPAIAPLPHLRQAPLEPSASAGEEAASIIVRPLRAGERVGLGGVRMCSSGSSSSGGQVAADSSHLHH